MFATVIAATPRQKPSSATTTPPGTAFVRIIGNPNHTAATSTERLAVRGGDGGLLELGLELDAADALGVGGRMGHGHGALSSKARGWTVLRLGCGGDCG